MNPAGNDIQYHQRVIQMLRDQVTFHSQCSIGIQRSAVRLGSALSSHYPAIASDIRQVFEY
ncbi:MAG: hypothetical protein ABIT70_01235, partial [Sulfuriferula sp.]